MSRKYKGLIVLNTKLLDGNIDDLVSSISKELQAEGAKIENVAQLGRRDFAYESKHLRSGHYLSYTFSAAPDVIVKLTKKLQLNTQVHSQHYQRVA